MYTRFYNSIISPRNLVEYRNDSLFRVFFYILFFALLLSTRSIIDIATFDGMTQVNKEEIITNFQDVNETCEILNSSLACESKDSTLMYTASIMSFYTDSFDNWNPSVYQDASYNFVLHEDAIHLVVSGQDVTQILISELPQNLHNFDFELYETDPTTFFNIIFEAIDEYMINTKLIWGSVLLLIDFFTNLIMFLLFVMISSWMLRMRFKQVKFKQLFTLTSYSSTALYVILIINSLYNLSFFIVAILLFVAIRQNSQLSMELQRRLTKKP